LNSSQNILAFPFQEYYLCVLPYCDFATVNLSEALLHLMRNRFLAELRKHRVFYFTMLGLTVWESHPRK